MSADVHTTRSDKPWVEPSLFPSPHWSVHAAITFDGVRGITEVDITVSQWTADYCIDQYSTVTFPIDQDLTAVLELIAQRLRSTQAQVSPF